MVEVEAWQSRMSEWGKRTLDQADSEQMDVAQKSPGRIGDGTLAVTLSEQAVEHQGLVLELRPLEEER